MPPIYFLGDENIFPHPTLSNPDGLLCIGGDLKSDRLLLAYQMGIFPWYNEGEPILWWSPDPRMVLYPLELKVSKSMRSVFNQKKYSVSFDKEFEDVISACQSTYRKGQGGTWITEEMKQAYLNLHELGYAHSVEVWNGEILVAGLYGIAIGKVFFGESMFTRESNASKFGFISLVRLLIKNNFILIDCQQETNHMRSLGARPITRDLFLEHLGSNYKFMNEGIKWNI